MEEKLKFAWAQVELLEFERFVVYLYPNFIPTICPSFAFAILSPSVLNVAFG